MINLTPRQLELIRFIRVYRAERGVQPNYREMMAGLGVKSAGTMAHMIAELVERGAIRKDSRRSRDFELIEETGVTLNPEICRLVDDYAKEQSIGRDTAANELLRQTLGAA